MKKYPRNEQLKPMQLSVHETSDNKSPLSLGRICNWFLPRRNYPFSSSLTAHTPLDYEILLLNWLRNQNTTFSKKMDRSSFNQFPIISVPTFLFFPLSASLLHFVSISIEIHYSCPRASSILLFEKKLVKNKLLIFIFNRKLFSFARERKIVLSLSPSLMKKKKGGIFDASMAPFRSINQPGDSPKTRLPVTEGRSLAFADAVTKPIAAA